MLPPGNTDLFDVSCANCETPGNHPSCSACNMAKYCSRDCQRAHYKAHKHICKTAGKPQIVGLDGRFLAAADHKRCGGMNCSNPPTIQVTIPDMRYSTRVGNLTTEFAKPPSFPLFPLTPEQQALDQRQTNTQGPFTPVNIRFKLCLSCYGTETSTDGKTLNWSANTLHGVCRRNKLVARSCFMPDGTVDQILAGDDVIDAMMRKHSYDAGTQQVAVDCSKTALSAANTLRKFGSKESDKNIDLVKQMCVYCKVLVETGKLKKCACGEARYCSPHCQFYHWFNYEDAHKERCEEIRKAKEGK